MMPLFSSLLHFATLTQLPSYRSTVPKARNPLVVVPETDLCTCHIYVIPTHRKHAVLFCQTATKIQIQFSLWS